MTDPTVVIIGSFLLAFKAILIEGSEVAILSLATIKQLGRNNILFGVIAGGLGSIVTFLVVWRGFLFLPPIVMVLAAAGAFNIQWTLIGAAVSLIVLIGVSAVSYDYLMRVPRWLLDLIAGVVLLSFGLIFLGSGILSALTGTT